MLDKRDLMDGKVYLDRGMKKWQGLILSEHRDVLKQIHEEYQKEYVAPMQQEVDEINATLNTAFLKEYKVWMALNQIDENGIYEELQGYIRGYDGNYIIVNDIHVRAETIRCVEFIDRLKFWQKQ